MKVKIMIAVIFVIIILLSIAYFGFINESVKPNTGQGTNTQLIVKNPDEKTEPAVDDKDYGEIGFDLMRQESLGVLKDGMSAVEVINNLGEPVQRSKAVEWGADGLVHQTWFYHEKGIELDLVKDEEKQAVNMITIKSPCRFRTNRNIGIGSTKDEVITAYQEEINPESGNNDSIVAGSVYGGMIFSFEKEQVSEIFIGAAAE